MLSICFESNPQQGDIQILADGLSHYAKLKKNHRPIEGFAFFVRNEQGVILGGCNGTMYYGCLYIDQLWLDETLWRKKLGSQLVQAAEKLAQERGCLFATVNTMDWEALEFYQKIGYKVEYKRSGHLLDSKLYFLRKDLVEVCP